MMTPKEAFMKMPINGHSWEYQDWIRDIQDDAIRSRATGHEIPLIPHSENHPIQLSMAHETIVDTWAFDGRLWATESTVRFNLRTFARAILKVSGWRTQGDCGL